MLGTKAFFANQAGGTITIVPIELVSGGVLPFNTVLVQVGLGPRALAVDERNNLLLALNQGNGKITLIDLTDNRVIGSIDLTA